MYNACLIITFLFCFFYLCDVCCFFVLFLFIFGLVLSHHVLMACVFVLGELMLFVVDLVVMFLCFLSWVQLYILCMCFVIIINVFNVFVLFYNYILYCLYLLLYGRLFFVVIKCMFVICGPLSLVVSYVYIYIVNDVVVVGCCNCMYICCVCLVFVLFMCCVCLVFVLFMCCVC